MKIFRIRKLEGFSLIELILALVLLSTVILTAITVEVSVRKMQAKVQFKADLLNELIPVVEKMKKDFKMQIGNLDYPGLYVDAGRNWFAVRVDADNSGTITSGDEWHAYRWNTTVGDPLEYSPNNFTTPDLYDVIANNITYFMVYHPFGNSYNDTGLVINIGTRENPALPEDPVTNPGANLTTTVY